MRIAPQIMLLVMGVAPTTAVAQQLLIESVAGTVTVSHGHSTPAPAVAQAELAPGDILHTALEGRATLRRGENLVRVDGDSFVEVEPAPGRELRLRVTQGSVAAEIVRLGDGEVWTVRSLAAITQMTLPGNYRVSADPGMALLRLAEALRATQSGAGTGPVDLPNTGPAGVPYNQPDYLWVEPNAGRPRVEQHEVNRHRAERLVEQAVRPSGSSTSGPILAPAPAIPVPVIPQPVQIPYPTGLPLPGPPQVIYIQP